MHKKTILVLRMLALLTGLVALGGLLFVSLDIWVYFAGRRNLDSEIESFSYLYAGLILVNLTFVGLLLASAFLLWRLHRRGLFLLVITLCLELAYFLSLVGSNMVLGANGPGLAIARLTGVGMSAVGVQVYTAYPLFALILLTIAYRHLGIPGQTPGQND